MRRKNALSTWLLVFVLAAAFGSHAARASDLSWSAGPPRSPPVLAAASDPVNSFEARLGVFAHGIGGVERGTYDLNGEVVSPRLGSVSQAGLWSFLIPRVHLGGSLNLGNRTSFAYTGLLWTIPVWDRFFVEGFIGPAIHDGSFGPTATRAGLGCPVLFHAGASAGYRFTRQWSVLATFEHLSNGRELFGINCGTNVGPGRNQGLNNYGLRIGYSF